MKGQERKAYVVAHFEELDKVLREAEVSGVYFHEALRAHAQAMKDSGLYSHTTYVGDIAWSIASEVKYLRGEK